jgi:(p)ppGpp synthase/HD superfamily hydrolase
MNERILKARKFAIERHGDQKYGELPYIYHLDMVYETALAFNLDEDYQVAAYLHDTLEDTKTTKKELEEIFGKRVAEMVFSVTGEGETRKDKKASMIRKLEAFPEGINLKMVDRYANMKESLHIPKLFKMYESELEAYAPLFEKGNEELYKLILSLKLPNSSPKP